jgi:lysyl-tRNA synthetase class 2
VRRLFNTSATTLTTAVFYEIEAPTPLKNPGITTAKPFYTHCNDLRTNQNQRIATELPLKQLVVGDIHKVYELGRQFRHKGIDLTHNRGFTLCEYYKAFTDVHDIAEYTETLVEGMMQTMCRTLQMALITQYGKIYNVGWSRPWK